MKTKIIASLLAGLGLSAFAASTTVTIPAGGFTNVVYPNNGNIKATQFILSAGGTATSVSVYDTTTNSTVLVNPAYTNIVSYATNVPVYWTNYFGVVNGWTNVALVSVTNSVAASTNPAPVRFSASAIANSSFRADSVNYYFYNGMWATNTGSGTATLTVTYQQ